jgi:hypothetical protein
MIVTNNGGSATSGTVTVNNTPPAALTVNTISGGRGWKCSLGSPLSCTRNDPLQPGLTYYPITVTVSVTGSPGNVSNSATVSGGSISGTVTATDTILITQ